MGDVAIRVGHAWTPIDQVRKAFVAIHPIEGAYYVTFVGFVEPFLERQHRIHDAICDLLPGCVFSFDVILINEEKERENHESETADGERLDKSAFVHSRVEELRWNALKQG